MNKWSPHLEDWFEGDPIFDTPTQHPDDKREDAIFATLAEVVISRRPLYLDGLQRQECLSARGRRYIERIISSPHKSDCAAAMEMERTRWEERQYKP